MTDPTQTTDPTPTIDRQSAFEAACASFTRSCQAAASWKHRYSGAAYSTRLTAACDELERAIAECREALIKDMS